MSQSVTDQFSTTGDSQFSRPELAARALEDLLTLRLFADRDADQIEKALIMRVWLFSQESTLTDASPTTLQTLLTTYHDTMQQPLSVAVTDAAQTVRMAVSTLCDCTDGD